MADVWELYLLAQAAYLQNQSTFSLISSSTLSAATASLTFSSIPQIYSSLMLVLDVKSASTATGFTADNAVIQLNGITTATYTACTLSITQAGTPQAANATGVVSSGIGNIWNSFSGNTPGAGGIVMFFPGYSTVSFRNNFVSFAYASDGGGSSELTLSGGSSQSTAAVTSMKVFTGSGSNFVAGSYIALYGM